MGLHTTLKALSDPTRREILNLLKDGKRSAGEISDRFDITAAAIVLYRLNLPGMTVLILKREFSE